jgi:WD40 repeat protein
LADGVLPGSDHWRQVLMRPGEHPLRALAEAGYSSGAPADADQTNASGHGGKGDNHSLPGGGGDRLLRPIAGQERVLLIVDQFEEAFTICHDEAERAMFLATLVEAAQTDNSVTVVMAVRADYYGHCAADPALAGLLAANHVLVGPMDAGELRRAVELPARRAGLRLDPGLAEAMISEVAEEPGGLPLLSCALLESWQHRHGRTLTLAAYQQAGGVHGAVARLAEHAWLALDPQDQAMARRILLRLAGPGEGEAAVRRRVPLNEVALTHDERGRAVLDALTDQRLVTRSQDSVEVAHEALLREWPRLRGWLEDDVQGRALHRHLIGAAREWDAAGRDPGELYRGARLTGALDWAATHDTDLNQLEREFLDAGRAAAEREVTAARRRAEHEARTSRRLRGLLAGLAVVLVLALVAGGLALSLRGRAERQALVADSRRLGAQALLEDDLDRSLLLARQGIALDDSLETRSDLLAALLRSPAATAILRGDLDGIGALGLSRDGRLLAAGDGAGRVAIYDVRTRKLLQQTFQGQHGQLRELEFSPDGSLLAMPSSELTTTLPLWDVRGAKVRQRVSWAHDRFITGVEFSTDGRTLVTLTEDEPDYSAPIDKGDAFLTRWDVSTGRRLKGPVRVSSHAGDALLTSLDAKRLIVVNNSQVLVEAADTFQQLRRFPHPQPQAYAAALSPTDDRTLALLPDDGPIVFLDLVSGHRRTGGRHASQNWSVRFSPDGKTLATGGGDGTVKIWDVASGQLRETFQGHEARVAGLRFSVDGRTLYSSGSKSVIAWDLEGSSRLGRPYSVFTGSVPSGFIGSNPSALAISADGALLAAPLAMAPDKAVLLDLHAPRPARRQVTPGIGRISAMVFSPDGNRLAVTGDDAPTPVLIDVNSGRVQERMTGGGHRGEVSSMVFAPDGTRLVTGGNRDGQAIVWDTETGRPIRHLQDPTTNEQQAIPFAVIVGWSPDGSIVATGGGQGRILLWRTTDWMQVGALAADTSWVYCMAFSPDGSRLAAGGVGERQATIWDVASRKLLSRLPHPNFVTSVAFDPAGRTLATSAGDFKIRLWDLASQRQIGRPLPGSETGSGTNVSAFDPSGNHLIAVYDSGAAFVWDMDLDHWKQQACAVVGRILTQKEWTELLPDRRYQPACR